MLSGTGTAAGSASAAAATGSSVTVVQAPSARTAALARRNAFISLSIGPGSGQQARHLCTRPYRFAAEPQATAALSRRRGLSQYDGETEETPSWPVPKPSSC